MSEPTLRWLSAADVEAAMPSIERRLELAAETMTALGGEAELPSKIGVHPRPEGSFAHAMPAYRRGPDPGGASDGLGIKWVAGFGANRELGLPAISAVLILNDPRTGVPIAILDAGPITAQRTAAVSAVAIRQLTSVAGSRRVALIGAGVQGRSHVAALAYVLPGLHLAIHDRHADRAEALVAVANETPGVADAHVAPSARDAVAAADVVVTAASFAPPAERQVMTNEWLTPDALVVAVDYATLVAAEVAREAALFVVDERDQFLANRDAGAFEGYPEPGQTIGELIRAGTRRPATGRVLVTHLGVGLADVLFGRSILERATELGLGTNLPR